MLGASSAAGCGFLRPAPFGAHNRRVPTSPLRISFQEVLIALTAVRKELVDG